jgi:hypothetical protein
VKATSLPKALYPRESLAHAAAVVDARVGLASSGRRWLLSVEPAALEGEFLNEALSHARRQARLREARAVASAVAARLMSGFPAAPADPLEQLEPQVRLDRAEETSALLERARRQE